MRRLAFGWYPPVGLALPTFRQLVSPLSGVSQPRRGIDIEITEDRSGQRRSGCIRSRVSERWRQDRLGRRRAIAERGMRSDRIVVPRPAARAGSPASQPGHYLALLHPPQMVNALWAAILRRADRLDRWCAPCYQYLSVCKRS